jgi:magnesium transporter
MKHRKKNYRNPRHDLSVKGKRASGKAGLPAGSMVHIGKILTDSVKIDITTFNASVMSRKTTGTIEGFDISDTSVNNWIEVKGLHEIPVIESFGKTLNISAMMLEDILNTEHRPKVDFRDDLLFLTMKAFSLSDNKEINSEQVSFILGSNYLVSFQESDFLWYEPVSTRLMDASGQIRQKGLDFILYSLIDLIIDRYYAVIEAVGDQLEDLEEMIFEKPDQALLEKNRLIKKEIITMRKALVPTLEAINRLTREKPVLISEGIMRYFDDVHDHIIQILDYVETYRELSAELKENYVSNITLRMNKVMKLLTIITTIFIPLTFIAGIYGMNFKNMPELYWKYGYFLVLAIMLTITAGMLIYFKVRRWF